jgi:hypothetical protein
MCINYVVYKKRIITTVYTLEQHPTGSTAFVHMLNSLLLLISMLERPRGIISWHAATKRRSILFPPFSSQPRNDGFFNTEKVIDWPYQLMARLLSRTCPSFLSRPRLVLVKVIGYSNGPCTEGIVFVKRTTHPGCIRVASKSRTSIVDDAGRRQSGSQPQAV